MKLVSMRNVRTHVLDLVVRMPTAELSTIVLSVPADLAIQESREFDAVSFHHLHHHLSHHPRLTLAYRRPVDHIRNVETSTAIHLVPVCPATLATRLIVDQNV
uniref:Uncharacterized protein n=1 Tax=Cacopsylla melanoneura TaxID=428564 RepID=A0A8D8VZX7_9HEMI